MNKRTWYLGASMTASWAWGSSLMVGMALLLEKGLVPFLIWAGCNSLMLPFFGYMVKKYPNFEKATGTKGFVLLMTVMQFFITWVNMQAIFMVSEKLGMSPLAGKVLAIGIGLFFILMVFKGGLELSIFTDFWQWAIMYVGVISIVIIGFLTGVGTNTVSLLMNGTSDILPNGGSVPHVIWAIYGGASLLCGGFIDLQQWQRAKVAIREGQEKAFIIGGALFAIYIGIIGFMAHFQFSYIMTLILMVVAIMVTSSTLDSAGAAFQEIGGNKIGAVLGILAVLSWQFVYSIGIINIWNYYATFRLVIVAVMIVTVLIWTHVENKKKAFN
jgi:Na+/proline symporter